MVGEGKRTGRTGSVKRMIQYLFVTNRLKKEEEEYENLSDLRVTAGLFGASRQGDQLPGMVLGGGADGTLDPEGWIQALGRHTVFRRDQAVDLVAGEGVHGLPLVIDSIS